MSNFCCRFKCEAKHTSSEAVKALMSAIVLQHEPCFQRVLEIVPASLIASPEPINQNGDSMLTVALTWDETLRFVRPLIQKGASVLTSIEPERASREQLRNLFPQLNASKLNPVLYNLSGLQTVFMERACHLGDLPRLKLFVEGGYRFDPTLPLLNILLDAEVKIHLEARRLQALKLLLANGANPNATSDEYDRTRKRTALHTACAGGFVEAMRLLIEAGADVSRRNWFGEEPAALLAHVRSLSRKLQGMRLMLERGADANGRFMGRPLLHYAMSVEEINLLLDHGALIDQISVIAETALCHRVRSRSDVPLFTVVERLAERGASFRIIDKKKGSVLSAALSAPISVDDIIEGFPQLFDIIIRHDPFYLRTALASDTSNAIAERVRKSCRTKRSDKLGVIFSMRADRAMYDATRMLTGFFCDQRPAGSSDELHWSDLPPDVRETILVKAKWVRDRSSTAPPFYTPDAPEPEPRDPSLQQIDKDEVDGALEVLLRYSSDSDESDSDGPAMWGPVIEDREDSESDSDEDAAWAESSDDSRSS